MAQFGLVCDAIEAVVLGRTGDRAGATALMADVRAPAAPPAAQLRAHARAGDAHRTGRAARRLGRPGDVAARGRGVLRRGRLRPHRPPLPHDAGRGGRPDAAPRPGRIDRARRRCARSV